MTPFFALLLWLTCGSFAFATQVMDATSYGPSSIERPPNFLVVYSEYVSGDRYHPAYVDKPTCPGGGEYRINLLPQGESLLPSETDSFDIRAIDIPGGTQWKIVTDGDSLKFQALAIVECYYHPEQ